MARSKIRFSFVLSGFLFVLTTAFPEDHCEIMSISVDNSSIPNNQRLSWHRGSDASLHFSFVDDHGFSGNEHGLMRISIHYLGKRNGKIRTTTSFVSNNHVEAFETPIELTKNNKSVKMTEELLLDVKHGVRTRILFCESLRLNFRIDII